MSFLFPTLLTIGLPLVAVPILIHLINLRRQQRIRWAAMQFLLESQQRNRRWILLKQLLLLATRMGIIALVVLMLAHLIVRNEWLRLLGSGTTHHLVLLDDSYSMSDRWDNTSAMAEGKRAVQAIVDQLEPAHALGGHTCDPARNVRFHDGGLRCADQDTAAIRHPAPAALTVRIQAQ